MADKESKRYAVSVVGHNGSDYMNRLNIAIATSEQEAKGYALESFAKDCPDCTVSANICCVEVPASQHDTGLVTALEEIARYTHGSMSCKAEYVNTQATKALDKFKGK